MVAEKYGELQLTECQPPFPSPFPPRGRCIPRPPTQQICYEHCKAEGAAYFANQYGYECWCYVSGRADFDRHGGGAVCDMPCKGDEVCDARTFVCFVAHTTNIFLSDWPRRNIAPTQFCPRLPKPRS